MVLILSSMYHFWQYSKINLTQPPILAEIVRIDSQSIRNALFVPILTVLRNGAAGWESAGQGTWHFN